MRLIDADKLKEQIERIEYTYDYEYEEAMKSDCIDAVDEALTVNAVSVVRCRYCKYGGGTVLFPGKKLCTRFRDYVEEEDFCSRGDLKGSDTT